MRLAGPTSVLRRHDACIRATTQARPDDHPRAAPRPWLSALWLGLVTPVYARIGRAIIESIVHVTVVRDNAALKTFSVRPIGIDDAISRALTHEERHVVATRWSDALSSSGKLPSWGDAQFGTRMIDSRSLKVEAPPEVVFKCVERIGGDNGWYAWNWLWRLVASSTCFKGAWA